MKKTSPETCHSCAKEVAAYNSVSTNGKAGSELLCGRCFNERMAERMGLDFAHPEFEDLSLNDCRGKPHLFHFHAQLAPSGLLVEAFEIVRGRRGGYEFSILGGFEADPLELLAGLLMRMRRALAREHLEMGKSDYPVGVPQTLRGRISSDDESDGRLPMMVIDGVEVTWEQLGHMLMTYEGWQFKLQIYDRTEEVP